MSDETGKIEIDPAVEVMLTTHATPDADSVPIEEHVGEDGDDRIVAEELER